MGLGIYRQQTWLPGKRSHSQWPSYSCESLSYHSSSPYCASSARPSLSPFCTPPATLPSMSITNLVPLLPLLTSTAYLQFAIDETFFFSLFLRPSHSAQSATLLPSYLSAFSRPALLIIASILGTQLLTSLAAIALSEQTFWYWAGFALTLAHFPFAPLAAPLLVDIAKMERGKEKEEEVRGKMERFLRVHAMRSWTVNLGAWVCFGVAAVQRMT